MIPIRYVNAPTLRINKKFTRKTIPIIFTPSKTQTTLDDTLNE